MKDFALIFFSLSLSLTLAGCNRNPDSGANTNSQPVPPPPASAQAPGSSAASANAAPQAAEQPKVIVQDTFQENSKPDNYYNNMELTGVKPAPVNLPNATWQLAAGDGTYESYLTPTTTSGAACFHHVASNALNLASNGTYVKPAVMTLGADMGFSGETTTGTCILGFYSTLLGPHTSNVLANFTGLVLQNNGSLQLVENGKTSGQPIKFTGDYDPHRGAVTLSYSVDSTKGTISNVSLTGSTSDYAMTSTAFTRSATVFAGVGGSNDTSFSYINGVKISSGIVLPPPPMPTTQDSSETNAP